MGGLSQARKCWTVASSSLLNFPSNAPTSALISHTSLWWPNKYLQFKTQPRRSGKRTCEDGPPVIERNAACHSLLQHLLYEQRQAELFKGICKANKGVLYFSIALALQIRQKQARDTL